MKYLKEYNEHKDYERISYYKYDDDIRHKKTDTFLKGEISIIKSLNNELELRNNGMFEYLFSGGKNPMTIVKLDDYYFYLNDRKRGHFYKCDQIEGLIQLLKDISD